MSLIKTVNEWHLGDNLIHLNYLIRLSRQNPQLHFEHFLRADYIDDLVPLISESNISLFPLGDAHEDAINCWIGHENFFHNSPLRNDWVEFHMDFFRRLSLALKLDSPIKSADDLLFDMQILNGDSPLGEEIDFLIVNSTPLSCQSPEFNDFYLNNLAKIMVTQGFRVITTHPNGCCTSALELGFKLHEIARLAMRCKGVIGIPNGPMWLTFNVFANPNLLCRIVWLGPQKLNLGSNCLSIERSIDITNALIKLGFLKFAFL
jgi:hypothetical protein